MSNETLREALARTTQFLKDGDTLGASLALCEVEKLIDALYQPSLKRQRGRHDPMSLRNGSAALSQLLLPAGLVGVFAKTRFMPPSIKRRESRMSERLLNPTGTTSTMLEASAQGQTGAILGVMCNAPGRHGRPVRNPTAKPSPSTGPRWRRYKQSASLKFQPAQFLKLGKTCMQFKKLHPPPSPKPSEC